MLDQHYARALSPHLTCAELIALTPSLRGAPPAAARARALELLDARRAAGSRRRAAAELSGGEQQRVAVCAAIAHRPGLLLADEPAGELDEAAARTVYALLGELVREQGATAVIVEPRPRLGGHRGPRAGHPRRTPQRRGGTHRRAAPGGRTGRVDPAPRGAAPRRGPRQARTGERRRRRTCCCSRRPRRRARAEPAPIPRLPRARRSSRRSGASRARTATAPAHAPCWAASTRPSARGA